MATLTLPPLVIQSQASTAIVVTPVTGLIAPVAPGVTVYNGTVEPKGWLGTLSLIDGDGLVLGAATGNTFTIMTGPAGLSGAPLVGGTITSNP